MRKILGLDLGSTSVGWAFVQEDDEQSKIIGAGVRVVPISTDEANDFQKGNAISINKNRTLARGARRGLQRFKLRDISKSPDHYGLSLILGGAESNLWDL